MDNYRWSMVFAGLAIINAASAFYYHVFVQFLLAVFCLTLSIFSMREHYKEMEG